MATTESSTDRVEIGERVIALRSEGKSLATIAKTIGVARSVDAFIALADAIARRPKREQAKLRADETGRLDAIEERTRRKHEGDELDRKLASIQKLRKRLAAG